MVSPIITPYRWYNRFYRQNRYDTDCHNECEFKLITDKNHLLPFQIKRDASAYTVDKWLLRKACTEAEAKMLSQENSLFYGSYQNDWTIIGCDTRTIDTGAIRTTSTGATRTITVAACQSIEKNCNILRSGSSSGTIAYLSTLTVGKKYRACVTIGEVSLVSGSNLNLDFKEGANVVINNVNEVGYYEIEFTATSTDFGFTVNADGTVDQYDYIGIQELQIVELFNQSSEDIELDASLLYLRNLGDTDRIIYFGDALNTKIPAGDYYSVIITTDETVYFSEVITVKDFIPTKSNYYTIEWGNSCDIQDVLFQEVSGNTYKNKIYLDNSIATRPEYPFKEEAEEDGNKKINPTFQKWEKRIEMLVGKCPEFIVDSLTAIRLHNDISIIRPLRKEQLQANETETIESVEYDVAYVFNDCFANVSLKMLLEDKYIDTACCSNNVITEDECLSCDHTYDSDINDFSSTTDGARTFAWIDEVGGHANGVWYYSESFGGWAFDETFNNQDLICVNNGSFVYNEGDPAYWTPIFEVNPYYSPGLGFQIDYFSQIVPCFVQLEYSIDGGSTWIKGEIKEAEDAGTFELNITQTADTLFRIHGWTLSCDLNYSAPVLIEY